MNGSIIFTKVFPALALAAALAASALPAQAGRYMTVKDKTVKEECGACHMAFSPRMLPARSWDAIMSNLSEHFGEDASLDPIPTQLIRDYLMKNAADTGRWQSRFMRGVRKKDTPDRITKTPYWIRKHKWEVSRRAWKRAGSKANCTACHRGAEKGYYDDD